MSGVPQGTTSLLVVYQRPTISSWPRYHCLSIRRRLPHLQTNKIHRRPHPTPERPGRSEYMGDAWGMKFNESKCNILTITNLETTTSWFCTLNSVILQHVDSAKYLGIRIHKSLRFSEHINATAKKCSQCLNWIPQEDPTPVPPRTERTGLHHIVRSCAEYGAVVWDPFLKKDKQALKKIQNRAASWVSGVNRY